jgi:hypothetical protein
VDPEATIISIAGFCKLGADHGGQVVITDCQKQTQRDETGSEQVTYVPNTEFRLRFIPQPREEEDGSRADTGTYIPGWNYCNDVWSKNPPKTTITGKNPFFHPEIGNNLRRQMSHIRGPTIDRLGLVSAEVGEMIDIQAETVRKGGTVDDAFSVYATTYNFGVVPDTDDYSVCDPMRPAAQVVEQARRGLEILAEKM